MRYIVINPKNFNLSAVTKLPKQGFVVPLRLERIFRDLSPLEQIVYYEIFYRSVGAEDKRKGKRRVAYCLIEPDPWLIALAYIMWQGILQGLSWDIIKIAVKSALDKLRSFGVAPPSVSKKRIRSETELGFSWSQYSNDGRKLYHMFIGLRRICNKMTDEERRVISNSKIHEKRDGRRKK